MKKPCNHNSTTYSGEALFGQLCCTKCDQTLCGVGEFFLDNKDELWNNGARGFYFEDNSVNDHYVQIAINSGYELNGNEIIRRPKTHQI